jgi:hypothetical protein
MTRFVLQLLYLRGQNSQYQLNKRPDGPRVQPGRFRKRDILCFCCKTKNVAVCCVELRESGDKTARIRNHRTR